MDDSLSMQYPLLLTFFSDPLPIIPEESLVEFRYWYTKVEDHYFLFFLSVFSFPLFESKMVEIPLTFKKSRSQSSTNPKHNWFQMIYSMPKVLNSRQSLLNLFLIAMKMNVRRCWDQNLPVWYSHLYLVIHFKASSYINNQILPINNFMLVQILDGHQNLCSIKSASK